MYNRALAKPGFLLLISLWLGIISAQPVCKAADQEAYFMLENGGTRLVLQNPSKDLIGISLHMRLPSEKQFKQLVADTNSLSMSKILSDGTLIVGISSINHTSLGKMPLSIELNESLKRIPKTQKFRLFHFVDNEIIIRDLSSGKPPFPLWSFILALLALLLGITLILYIVFKEKIDTFILSTIDTLKTRISSVRPFQ